MFPQTVKGSRAIGQHCHPSAVLRHHFASARVTVVCGLRANASTDSRMAGDERNKSAPCELPAWDQMPVNAKGIASAWEMFRESGAAGAALGANMLGAVVGGWAEYASMA